MTFQEPVSVYPQSFTVEPDSACFIVEEQQYRASAYSLLAALLRNSPDKQMLERLSGLTQQLQGEDDSLMVSMSMLGLSSRILSVSAIADEFHALFIGLGKGEIVPYGSWYLTGFLMEKPLSDLRDDLKKLGFVRNQSVTEPEDHAAALCEVISLMISENTELDVQKKFFLTHIASWMGRFFNDLSEAESAVFYKAMGRFGAEFINFENQYLTMQS